MQNKPLFLTRHAKNRMRRDKVSVKDIEAAVVATGGEAVAAGTFVETAALVSGTTLVIVALGGDEAPDKADFVIEVATDAYEGIKECLHP